MASRAFWTGASLEIPDSRTSFSVLPDWESANFSIELVPSTVTSDATVSAPTDSSTVKEAPGVTAFVREDLVSGATLPLTSAVPETDSEPLAASVMVTARVPVWA
jgi:hypothetical protein